MGSMYTRVRAHELAYSIGAISRESTRGERAELFWQNEKQGTNRGWGKEEKDLLCDPGSEVRLEGREKIRGV